MKVPCLCLLLFLAVSVAAHAEILPARGTADSRIRTTLYRPDQVYRLYGFVGYEIELVFEEGETFIGRAGGDLAGIAFGSFGNHATLKPTAPGVVTNLVIFTDRRTYRFQYSVAAHPPDPATEEVMYAVQFSYPPKEPSAREMEAAHIEERLKQGTPRTVNRDYWYCGQPALEPNAASDDGVQTRLQFGMRKDWPAVFVRNDDGTESLLNFSVEDGAMLIHRVARQFILRRGRLTGCIVNKGYGGLGEQLKSGTLVPDIERHTRGGRP